jgi:hypothetical protein
VRFPNEHLKKFRNIIRMPKPLLSPSKVIVNGGQESCVWNEGCALRFPEVPFLPARIFQALNDFIERGHFGNFVFEQMPCEAHQVRVQRNSAAGLVS